jgi:uncharacterized tellurite resistance protein B-like protein
LIERIKQFFTTEISNTEGDLAHRQQLAAASLMVEVMVIDRHLEEEELSVIQRLLREKFDLDEAEIDHLITLAHQEVKESTSLYQFTRLVNDHFDQQSKNGLIMNLWEVALADDEIDKHEEAIIRRIAELIYVPHSDFIRAKHEARNRT